MILEEKVCTSCLRRLPLSEFYKNAKTKDGRYWRCKRCHLDGRLSQVKPKPKAAPEGYRWCRKCDGVKAVKRFRPDDYICQPCRRVEERLREPPTTEEKQEFNRRRYARTRSTALERAKRAARALRAEVLEHYGGICSCCGENDSRFLCLDHTNRDGAAHRKAVGGKGGTRFYYWVKKNGFPDDLRLLCYNCNMGREQNNGICPHEEGRLKLVV